MRSESVWFREDRLTIQDFSQMVDDPDIVLMGSSMIRMPFWCVDHKTDSISPEYISYHKAQQLEQKMREVGLLRSVYNLGADGAYASDLLLMFDKLLSGSRQPKLVVCAISPRELVSAWFVSARITPIYKLLAEPRDFFQTGNLYSSDATDWLDGCFWSLFPLYRHADSYKEFLLSKLQPDNSKNSENNGTNVLSNDIASSTKSTKVKFQIYENQKHCIEALVRIAKSRHLRVVFVNLPLREDGKQMIYSSIATDYRNFLLALGQTVSVLDLESDPVLKQKECFMDSWHLNQKGGERLIQEIVRWLRSHPEA
jgi:hypothetical protein